MFFYFPLEAVSLSFRAQFFFSSSAILNLQSLNMDVFGSVKNEPAGNAPSVEALGVADAASGSVLAIVSNASNAAMRIMATGPKTGRSGRAPA
jgi:hypothetical protein